MHAPKTDLERRLAAKWGWPLPIMAGGADGEGDPAPKHDPKDPPKPEGDGDSRTVPLAELQSERRKRQDLEQRLADLESEREQARQSELSEVERLKEQVSQLVKRAETAEQLVTRSERSRWVVDAAVAAGFDKPGAAVKLIDDLEGLDTEDAAIRAVKSVAKEYPGLLRDSNGGGPKLEQVLQDGKPPAGDTGEEKLLSKQELDSLSIERHMELDKTKPGLVERSLAALGT
jgi:preprotein translocase subunit SecD